VESNTGGRGEGDKKIKEIQEGKRGVIIHYQFDR
jgi:hypothetical protein